MNAWHTLGRIARYTWASPASFVGLALAVPMLLRGASTRIRAGVLEVAFEKPSARPRRIRFDAITFGHVVLGRSMRALDELQSHELVHVRQYEHWGILLLFAYPVSRLVQALRGKDPYSSNHFEMQARAQSRRDSW